ncbi:ACIDIC PROTEIN MAM33 MITOCHONDRIAL putative-RELATED [Salix koriyanagi]|uniref:ACIDIC PROTEIN MAM33 MITOCHONDRIAL putative-RELATED n=1 Tax=Salix koriyanagi TaxID=2511006 RepID=A0A9Q0UYW5_9ROSI|nr:ACIDIC PROTEIN MAM33 MITOCHONDRIAL putative-RELATED [Salix koriyanagi]
MAFNSVLRRASKSFLPLAVRAVGSPRTFHRTIPTVLSVENRTTLQNFLPFSHFSTAITAQKPTAEDNLGENIPNEFPFKLEDNLGERTISLNRKLQEETIKMVAGMPNVSIDADDNAKDSHVSSIPLVASATKGSDQYMVSGITAILDEIRIDSSSIKNVIPICFYLFVGGHMMERKSGLRNESSKTKRIVFFQRSAAVLLLPLIIIYKKVSSIFLPNLFLFRHINEGMKEIMADYVHQEMTRNWILIYLRLFLLILVKDVFLAFV